jgi:hypothetical protein
MIAHIRAADAVARDAVVHGHIRSQREIWKSRFIR